MGAPQHGEQLALIRQQVRGTRRTGWRPAPEQQVAQVAVDVPLAHLDRPFDYLVTESQHQQCVPGARVRVRFAGQERDGFVLRRAAESEHPGKLSPLRRVVSAEPVLLPEIANLTRLVADRYAGTMADVLRLAVPPRHARVEKEAGSTSPAGPADTAVASEAPAPVENPGGWADYPAGRSMLAALARGAAPRAIWTALPGADWPSLVALAAAATLSGGRGVVFVVPDATDLARLDAACARLLGAGRYVTLSADLGPAERYRRFLTLSRGQIRCVIGTRAASFAPVADIGLVGCWDDGDDLHAEPRAPYPHTREVLLLRAHAAGAAALIGGFARTAEAARLVESGWARDLVADRQTVRQRAPRVHTAGESDQELARDPAARGARLPHRAFEAARSALQSGPVLIQVPRRGYLPALACRGCRAGVRCPRCSGPIRLGDSGATPACGWCGSPLRGWRCAACGDSRFRAPVIGAVRTAEELGRAFPRVPIRTADAEHRPKIGAEPALVVATPGAEPVPSHGYAGALLLDSWIGLGRADLRAGEETLRRWFMAAALVRPAPDGGVVVLVADPTLPQAQSLVRWSPEGYAARELQERREAGLPPGSRLAAVEGDAAAIDEFADLLAVQRLPGSAQVLGPVPLDEEHSRLMVRAGHRDGARLAAVLSTVQRIRSARKLGGTVRVRLDPHQLG